MKIRILVLAFCILAITNCDRNKLTPSNTENPQSKAVSGLITCDQAIDLAKMDALQERKSLDGYTINAYEETKTWRVEFQLKDLTLGGGLMFIIDKETGKILERRESQ